MTVGAPSLARRPGRSRLRRAQRRAGWVLVLPALLHISVFLALPLLIAVVLGFSDYDFTATWSWIGLENYQELAGDERFRRALVNTVLYTIAVVPIAMALALAIAIGLNQRIRARGAMRAAYYLPVVTATVAVATVWLWIYDPETGLVNAVLGLFGIGSVRWLADPDTALPALMAVGVWQGLGAKIVIYLAALQGVRRELVESARVDGATSRLVFRHVTWPALRPVQFFVLVTSIIASFQVFDLVYVMTRGGPADSTTVLTFDIYQNAFSGLRLGYASAETVVTFLLIATFVYVGLRVQRADADED